MGSKNYCIVRPCTKSGDRGIIIDESSDFLLVYIPKAFRKNRISKDYLIKFKNAAKIQTAIVVENKRLEEEDLQFYKYNIEDSIKQWKPSPIVAFEKKPKYGWIFM